MNATTMVPEVNAAQPQTSRFIPRAPKGGTVSPVNGRFYAGGQFLPLVNQANAATVVTTANPAPLVGSSRQVAWANRLRAARLANLDDEIAARLLFLAGPKKSEAAEYRPIIRRLLIARHELASERSASRVIDRRFSAN